MKKFLKAGIAGAMACTLLGSAAMPASAKEVPVNTDQEVTKIAEEVTPRFMYTQTRTVTSPEFDTVVKIDTVETSSTSSGWKIVGVQDISIIPKSLSIPSWSSTYSYYDNYQGVNIKLEFYYLYAGKLNLGTRTVKVHI